MSVEERPGAGPSRRVPAFRSLLAGSGGAGVMTAGNMLLEAAAHAGYYALMTRSSGPQIRGGEAAAMLRIACHPVECMEDRFHVLAAVDWENVQRFSAEIPLGPDSLIVGDPDQGEPHEVFTRSGAARAQVPLKKLAKAMPEGRPNMVLLGLAATLLGLPDDAVARAVEKTLGKRPPRSHRASPPSRPDARPPQPSSGASRSPRRRRRGAARWLLTGNEAAGYGAIKGGVRFVAAYPITPATELLEWMSPALAEVGGTLVQAEDELASINMAIGGSYGGVPSLTATSGPGLALMVESLGLAVASEIPLVVVDVMRVGPSTGIPTKSEQGDLNIAVHGLHGDAPHLVLAPNSVADCLRTTQWAVQLAEALQVPAIVLSDQFLGQARAVIDDPPSSASAPATRGSSPGGCAGLPGATPSRRTAYRRWRSRARPASPTRPTASSTPSAARPRRRRPITSRSSTSAAQARACRLRRALGRHRGRWRPRDHHVRLVHRAGARRPGPRGADGVAARLVSLRLLAPPPARLAAALDGRAPRPGDRAEPLRAALQVPARRVRPAGRVTSLHRPGALQFQPGEIHRHLVEWSRA